MLECNCSCTKESKDMIATLPNIDLRISTIHSKGMYMYSRTRKMAAGPCSRHNGHVTNKESIRLGSRKLLIQ